MGERMNYELSQRIARAALEMVALESKKKEAERAFADALSACDVPRKDEFGYEVLVPMFERITVRSNYGLGGSYKWVYTAHMVDDAGHDCTSDQLWINQNYAWEQRKLARKNAGNAKASLTRLCRAEIKRGEK